MNFSIYALVSKIKKIVAKIYILSFFKQFFVKPDLPADINKTYLNLATFFGCGYFKHAPGTFTSFITIIIGLILVKISSIVLLVVICAVVIVGFISSEKIVQHTGDNQDPSFIVIDEVAGQLIPFLILGYHRFFDNILSALLIFVVFRLLDIYKPWIIGRSEKAFKGGVSVMIDDILAGIFTLFIVFIVLLLI